MSRVAVVLAALVLIAGAAPRRGAAAAPEGQLQEDERQFCERELEVVERRRRVFEGQGLPASEVARRNASELAELAECRDRFRAERRRAAEERQDVEEAARRAGPDATEKERERAWREIRRERLASKPPSSLTPEERAELAAGMADEVAATHAALDDAHSRDPAFMRVVHSALACYHGDVRERLAQQIASEEALLKLGSGDRRRLYALRSDLAQTEDVLSASREAARRYAGGLERCAAPTVGVVAHCLAIRFGGTRSEPACESEEIEQYVRLVK